MSISTYIATLHSTTLKLIDILIIFSVFYVATFLRQETYNIDEFYLIITSGVIYFLLAKIIGLYRVENISHLLSNTKNIIVTWLGTCFSIIFILFISKETESFSRLILLSWMITTPIVLILSRKLMTQYIITHQGNPINIAVVGINATSDIFLDHLETLKWPWLKIYGVYDYTSNPLLRRTSDKNESILYSYEPSEVRIKNKTQSINELITAVKTGHINSVYIALPLLTENNVEQLLIDLADTTASVYIIPDLFVTNILKSNWSHFAGLPVVNVYTTPFFGLNGIIKRLLDLALTILILLIIWPLMLAIAFAIKLSSKGPVLFKQRRYGLDGNIIKVWKFRSMSVCEDGPQVTQAKKNDVRITPLGKFLRKTSLDELPQFFNVLQGSLSVVGPRPHANAHNEEYRNLIKGYMLRHKVKPGITGLAQVKGWRGETDTLEKMENRVKYDLEYIQDWSIGLDLKIVLLTITHGFYNKNAY